MGCNFFWAIFCLFPVINPKGHWEKDFSQAVYESIRKIPKGEILVPSQPSIRFSSVIAPKEPLCPFFGPQVVWGQSAARFPALKLMIWKFTWWGNIQERSHLSVTNAYSIALIKIIQIRKRSISSYSYVHTRTHVTGLKWAMKRSL